MKETKKEEKKSKHIFLFFIKMFLIFIIIDFISILFVNICVHGVNNFKYGGELLSEIFYAIIMLVVMLLFKNSYVFTNDKTKFIKSLKYCIPMFIITGLILLGNLGELHNVTIGNLINALLLCAFVGIAEEFMCRGWVQNEFIERYGYDKKHIILSIILSSCIFGIIHLTNIAVQDAFTTLLQVLQATAIGFMFGSIYYKTKNIWTVAFLHGLYDFSIFLGEVNLIKDCTYTLPNLPTSIVSLISSLILIIYFVLSGILVLMQTDLKEKSKKVKDTSAVVLALIITFSCIFIPFEKLIKGYEDTEVCYEYTNTEMLKDFTVHYPYQKMYKIYYETEDVKYNTIGEEPIKVYDTINFKFELYRENKKLYIKNVNTGYKIELEYENVNNYDYEVIEEENEYLILIHSNDGNTSKIYYSNYITKENMDNTDEYLNNLKNSFTEIVLPSLNGFGYLTTEESNYKYPVFADSTNDYFIIKEDGLVYLMK